MSSFLKKVFVLCALLLVLCAPLDALAQATITLDQAEVDLWPEYDQPSMLVIQKYTLPSTVSLPFAMTVRIPASVGDPSAVASKQPDGSLFNLPYDKQVAGEWTELKFQATTGEVQVEYYDAALSTANPKRHYEYRWVGDYAVKSLVIQVQHPVDATEMTLSPSLGAGNRSSVDGLLYYTADQGPLSAGQQVAIKVDYTKTNDILSASQVKVQPSAPITDTTTGRLGLTSMLPWVIGALGLLLIAGGGIWYWRSGRGETREQQARRRRRASSIESEQSAGAQPSKGSNIYCHQCGKRAAPGDRFCRTCGTQLRTG